MLAPCAAIALAIAPLLLAAAGCGSRSDLQAQSGGAFGGGAGGATTGSGPAGSTSTSTSTAGAAGSAACKPGDGPTLLVSGKANQRALAIDSDFVYFAPEAAAGCDVESSICRISKAGGTVEKLWPAVWPVSALVVDETHVYWTDDPASPCTGQPDAGYRLYAGPKAGGKPLASAPAGQVTPAIAMGQNGSRVYWVDDGAALPSLFSAAKDGGAPEKVYSTMAQPTDVAADEASVYLASTAGILFSAAGQSAPQVLVKPPFQGGYIGLALDAERVYFGGWQPCQGAKCSDMGLVASAPKGQPGAPIQLAGDINWQPVSVAVDDTHVYWSQIKVGNGPPVPGQILRVAKDGSGRTQIAEGALPISLAVDDTCVFWANQGDGTIWKAPK